MLLPPQPTKSTWAYTSAASCSVCCTKAGSIQRTSYKRGESSKLYRKGRLEPRHALATLQRREAYSSHFHTQLHASRLWTAFGSGWKNGTSYFMGGRGPALSRDHAHTISDALPRRLCARIYMLHTFNELR